MCTYLSWTFFRGCCSPETRSRTCGSKNLFCRSPRRHPIINSRLKKLPSIDLRCVCLYEFACRVQVKTVIGQGVCIAHRIVGISQLNLISLSSTPKNRTMMYHFSRLISGFCAGWDFGIASEQFSEKIVFWVRMRIFKTFFWFTLKVYFRIW